MPTNGFMLKMAIALAAIVAINAMVRADGKYFRQSNVLAEPEIPSQRAIITFRDGLQTLIVESTVKGEGESLGWVLPLPAPPTTIEPCSAGTIRTMAALVQPEIKGDQFGKEWIQGSLTVLLIVIAACVIVTIAKRKGASLLAALLMVLLLLMYVGLLLPALAKARGGRNRAGVEVIQKAQIGSYDVSVVRGESGSEIKQWLTENGFAFDSPAANELDRYVAENWCFAVAKIRKGDVGELSPHPLKVLFPVESPVYPMRLTGLTDTDLQLDLYIIADKRAITRHLTTWHCDRFKQEKRKNFFEFEQTVFAGRKQGALIGHPELVSIMWPDCVLTHLHGTLTPKQMKQDMAIDCTIPIRSKKQTIYSHRAALGMSVGIAMLIAACAAIVLTVAMQRNSQSRMIKGSHVGLGAMAVCAVAGIIYLVCDVQTITSSTEHRWRSMRWVHDAGEGLLELKEHSPIDDFEAAFAKTHAGRYGGVLDGWKMDIPLGYEVRNNEERWDVTIYDRYAIPTRAVVNRQGEMTPLP